MSSKLLYEMKHAWPYQCDPEVKAQSEEWLPRATAYRSTAEIVTT